MWLGASLSKLEKPYDYGYGPRYSLACSSSLSTMAPEEPECLGRAIFIHFQAIFVLFSCRFGRLQSTEETESPSKAAPQRPWELPHAPFGLKEPLLLPLEEVRSPEAPRRRLRI